MKMTKRFWYFTTTYYCPICGGEKSYRYRVYGTKPKDRNKRERVVDTYDYCDV